MDDGHKYNNVTVGISISSKRTDLKRLSEYLSNICGLGNHIYDHGLKFTNEGSTKLMDLIKTYIIESMQYKMIPGYIGYYEPFELSFTERYEPLEVDILSINKEFNKSSKRFRRPYKRKKYDITIPDNHNFLAGSVEQGLVVHNTTTGGAALKFYASIRSAFYSGRTITKKVKGSEKRVGKLVTIRLIKNKVAPPRPTISKTPVYFNAKYEDVGFDRYAGLAEALLEEGVLEKTPGGVYKFKGKTVARGEEKLVAKLSEDDTLRAKLIRKAGLVTISVMKEKVASYTKNLFPIDGISYEHQNEASDEEDEEDEE